LTIFLKITQSAQMFRLLFNWKSCIQIFTKIWIGLPTFWATFSQNHPGSPWSSSRQYWTTLGGNWKPQIRFKLAIKWLFWRTGVPTSWHVATYGAKLAIAIATWLRLRLRFSAWPVKCYLSNATSERQMNFFHRYFVLGFLCDINAPCWHSIHKLLKMSLYGHSMSNFTSRGQLHS
jgi:hypothetical protein